MLHNKILQYVRWYLNETCLLIFACNITETYQIDLNHFSFMVRRLIDCWKTRNYHDTHVCISGVIQHGAIILNTILAGERFWCNFLRQFLVVSGIFCWLSINRTSIMSLTGYRATCILALPQHQSNFRIICMVHNIPHSLASGSWLRDSTSYVIPICICFVANPITNTKVFKFPGDTTMYFYMW